MPTLRSVLTQEKPIVPCTVTSRKNATSTKWPNFKGNGIKPWDDFSLAVLNKSYGHILNLNAPMEDMASALDAQGMLLRAEINGLEDVLHLVAWNDRLLRPTLKFAKNHAQLHNGVKLHHEAAKIGNKSYTKLAAGRPLYVHHRILLEDSETKSLVLGLGLPSIKFSARQLLEDPTIEEDSWPLRQLANLCKKAGTRYGYIVTERDLVVCCFHIPAFCTEPGRLVVSLKPIPWSLYGETQLTTDLALWWLCMLAMSDRQRSDIVTEAEMVSIAHWECPPVNSPSKCHSYSGVQLESEPTMKLDHPVQFDHNVQFDHPVQFDHTDQFDHTAQFDFNDQFGPTLPSLTIADDSQLPDQGTTGSTFGFDLDFYNP
ncbi:hypothetical protein CCM_09101 [Cordyceps militaris CM01]|uniref:Uncharacterized protein n=1 Tax=Cordyceps militaris (strain CM01) TaxID=983644 RepID=G3JTG1_CORMM|nr:uncharacterized protein CCM_09101 [Cordyceps militaris CM01]EGX87965.1 hypothetical protein CCM_09101 [Cordyceps militaris CM01]